MEVQTFPWYKNYPAEVPYDLEHLKHISLVDLVERSTNDFGPLPAFECMGTSISFDELDWLSRNFAAYLQNELGLAAGSRIIIQLPNLLQYPIALFGALRAGLIVVNTNPLYTSREMKHQYVDSGAETVVILANFADKLEKILPETSIKNIIITETGDQLGGMKKLLVNGAVKHIKKMVPKYHLPSAIAFNKLIKKGSKLPFKRVAPKTEDTAFLQYTGGTTGVSKGAVLSHMNVLGSVEQLSSFLTGNLIPGEEIIITALPLYHIYALTVNCLMIMMVGGKNVLIPNARDMDKFLKELSKHPFTLITGLNTLYNKMLSHPAIDKVDFSHLKITSASGMSIQQDVADRWKSKTGVPISEGYGLTETSGPLTSNLCVDGQQRIGTIGLPIPNTMVMIVDEQGMEVPYGVAGEIYAKGPQITKGYWKQVEETENALTKDRWFKTGDIGIMDEDGFIKIVDRKKEMINVSGFKVYPSEIEEVVAAHEKVLEAGAVGVADAQTTEAVKIYVVKQDPSLSKEELLAYCKENLTAYKVPKHIEFREELPKSNIGKILRRILKEENTLENA